MVPLYHFQRFLSHIRGLDTSKKKLVAILLGAKNQSSVMVSTVRLSTGPPMTKTNYSAKRHQGGFSLIDVLLALGVVILISGITLSGIRRTNESNQAKAVGEQMKSVGTALNTYVSLRYDALLMAEPGTDDIIGGGSNPSDPGPRSCVCTVGTGTCAAPSSVKTCTITSETLRRTGLVPNNFSGINAFGSAYEYRIRVSPQGGSTVLVDGMVWTEDAYTMEGEERYDLLGQAMLVAGADSGMTRSSLNVIEGFNGAWQEPDLDVNRLGVLAYRVGYGTFGYAAYLRLSGGEMLGDIDMGGNEIFNLNTVKSENVAANNLYLESDTRAITFTSNANLNLGDQDPIAPDYTVNPTIGTSGVNGLALRADAPILIERIDGTAGELTAGNVNATSADVTGVIVADGIRMRGAAAPTPGGISSQGTIITTNLIRGSNVVAGSGAGSIYTAMANSSNGGGIYFNADSTGSGGNIGFKLDNATSTISMGNANLALNGDVVASMNGSVGGTVRGMRRIEAGNNVIALDPDTNVTLNTTCTSLGTIRRSADGMLAQCSVDNFGAGNVLTWRAMSAGTGAITTVFSPTTACTGAGALPGNALTVSCAAGAVAISGGYRYASGAMRAAPQDSYRNGSTGWTIRPGPTQAYTGLETTQTCWNAVVVCSK